MDPLLEVFCALFVGFILILGSKKLLPILGKSGDGGGGGDGVQNKDEQLDADEEDEVAAASSSAAVSRKKGGKKAVAPTRQRDAKNKFSHPWLLCSLKAHNDTILDMQFSPHGKYLATCAEDRTVMLWPTRQFFEQQPRASRVNIEYDHASHVSWSPDNHALLVARHNDAALQVLKLSKKPDGLLGNAQVAVSFDKTGDVSLVGAAIASSGRYIMCCSERGVLTLYDLRGGVLTETDTHQGAIRRAIVSPCSNFILTAGFTPDAKVWEVCFSKSGAFEKLQRAFQLTGHTAGVLDLSVSPDSFRMLTASKDGTWILYNTNIEYRLGQSPQQLCGARFADPSLLEMACAALSPDGTTVAVSAHAQVQFFSAATAEKMATIDYLHPGPVRRLLFDPTSKFLLSAGDRQVRVLHNVPGWSVTVQDLKEKLSKCKNPSMKDRLSSQLVEAQDTVAKYDLTHTQ